MINKKINKELKKFIVTPKDSIKYALKKITNCGQRCIAVVDKNNNLLGTLADSDIRKALLLNININKSIRKIFNKKPYFVYQNKFTYNDLKNTITDRRLGIIPIISKKKKLFDKEFYKNNYDFIILSPGINIYNHKNNQRNHSVFPDRCAKSFIFCLSCLYHRERNK